MSFKSSNKFESRKEESTRVRNKYPDRIPIICEKINNKSSIDIPNIDKTKYLVPKDLVVNQFIYVIRSRMKLPPEKAIFLFVGGKIPTGTSLISEHYNQSKDPDGFLYIGYSGENTFG
jgi:GABA(A) receptor-associated protein